MDRIDDDPLEQMLKTLESFAFPVHHYRQFLNPSCLSHQAQLLVGLDCGYEVLAHGIVAFDKSLGRLWERYSPSIHLYSRITDRDRAFVDVCESLLTIPNGNNSMLRMMLRGRLGEHLYSVDYRAHRPPAIELPVEDRKKGYHPVIYALVHCNNEGQTPTYHQYMHVLAKMELYLDKSGSQGHENRDAYATEIDNMGCQTHPGLPQDRDWATTLNHAIHDKWKLQMHPRRYAYSAAKTASIQEFIKAFMIRLNRIPRQDQGRPIPWHLTYIGWSCKYEKRKIAHYTHGPGTDIKNFMETVMYYEYPHANYLMHMYPLTHVSSAAMVRSEHVISILVASYSCFGGLNGVAGGQQGDITNAGAQAEECWDVGTAALQVEGVLSSNIAKIQSQIEADQLVQKMEHIWPSYLDACASIATSHRESQDILIELVASNDLYTHLVIQNITDPWDNKWQIIQDEADFIVAGLQLLVDYGSVMVKIDKMKAFTALIPSTRQLAVGT